MAAPPGGDLAAQLYLALSAAGGEHAEAVAAILDGADAEAMRRVSEWEERRPPDADRPAPGGREAYITRGLTALHVLARDSADVAAVGRAIDLAGPEALATAGGFRKGIGGQPAARLPIHYAARDNSSPEVVHKLLDQGGLEQLQTKDSEGLLPIHYAVKYNSSSEVVQAILNAGSAVDDAARERSMAQHETLLAAPPASPAEMLAANPVSRRPAVTRFLAQQARQAGLADEAMRPGTRVRVGELGEGRYERFERWRVGCNVHYIRFATGVEKVELKKIARETWRVVPEMLPTEAAEPTEPEPDSDAGAVVLLPEGVPTESEPEPEPERTFASSNFKRAYVEAGIVPINNADQVTSEIQKFVFIYCHAYGVNSELQLIAATQFSDRLRQQAGAHEDGGGGDLMAPVRATAELLWTSALTFVGMSEHDKEFCWLLNKAIRDDLPELAPPTAALARGINAMCVEGRSGADLPFPAGGITYRGGGFDDQHKDFFTEGKVFRQPCFLATSFLQAKAEYFRGRAQVSGFQGILWVICTDPAGEHDVTKRCKHVNFVQHSLVAGEEEYLFATYSIFTVRSVTWGVDGAPHRIELDAASDNKVEAEGGEGRWATPVGSEDLPLAKWS